jgi:acyl carrier protein
MLSQFGYGKSTGIDLNEETDLAGDLGLDSLKVMELLVTVEDSLDISIPLNVLPRVRTIKDFAEQLQLLLSERSEWLSLTNYIQLARHSNTYKIVGWTLSTLS